MHTEFPYWLRWKNFTYRFVLSRSACRVHPRFLRDDSLIFRVLTPFCTTTVCLFVLWSIHFAYVWVCALTVSLVAICLTCVWGWQRYAWCFSHIVVWIVHMYMAVWMKSNFKFALVSCSMLDFYWIRLLTNKEQAMLTNWNIAITIPHSLLYINIEINDIIWIIILNIYNKYSRCHLKRIHL